MSPLGRCDGDVIMQVRAEWSLEVVVWAVMGLLAGRRDLYDDILVFASNAAFSARVTGDALRSEH